MEMGIVEVKSLPNAPFSWNAFDTLFTEVFTATDTQTPPPKSFPAHLTPERLFRAKDGRGTVITTSARRRIKQGPFEKLQSSNPKFKMHHLAGPDTTLYSFELPGIRKQDMHVSFQGCQVVVSWITYDESERYEENQRITERTQTRFARTIPLPTSISLQDIKASLQEGKLVISWPNRHDTLEFADY